MTLGFNLVALFDQHPEVIVIACIRIYYVVGFYILDGTIELFSGTLRGYGCSLPPALITLFAICGVRVLWIYTAFVAWPTFETIMMSYPVSWAPTVILLALLYRFYRRNLKVTRVLA